MIETKTVQRFGNSGHIVLPKEYVGKNVKFLLEPKTFKDIKYEVLKMLTPYLENILGIYLYGSYARNEQTIDSDVDILVIASTKFKIIEKIDDYSIVSTTLQEIDTLLNTNAVLMLPIVKEFKTIINPDLLERYKKHQFTKKNTKWFMGNSIKALELNKNGIELDFEIGSLVYSLMLRIRGLLMIKLIMDNNQYSKSSLFLFLEENGMPKNKVDELYRIYSNERNDIKIKKSDILTKQDIEKLLNTAKKLIERVKNNLT